MTTCPVCGKGEYSELTTNGYMLVSHLACVEKLATQIDLVRQSFDTTYPGLGDPFKLRERYDEMSTELAKAKEDATTERLNAEEWYLKAQGLQAELAALKVCGNCKWFRAEEYQNCGHPDVPTHEQGEYYISAPDKCDFTPSRWEARP